MSAYQSYLILSSQKQVISWLVMYKTLQWFLTRGLKRYVAISLRRTSNNKVLPMQNVYRTPNSIGMNLACHLMVLYSFFIADTAGNGCPAGFNGTTCNKENIALNKSASQSDRFKENYARLAVDGNTDTHVENGHCSHTGDTTNAYWTVTLNDTISYNITQFTLYLRDKLAYRYNNLRIFVDEILCKNIPISGNSGSPSPNPVNGQCDRTLKGNKVTVRVDNAYLTLCEVQIWVCSDGWFGGDCGIACRCNNTSETCDKENGYCRSGCAGGYHGDGCQTACGNKTYGFNCAQRCGKCRSAPCHHVTGVCDDGCEPGYDTPNCDKNCLSNTYGDNCSLPCGQCKDSSACHHVTGVCERGCEDGWRTEKCDMECGNRTYGENCASDCGQCFNNDVCDTVNGACPSGCLDGYVPPLCTTMISSDPDITSSPVGAIVGGVVVAILALVATGLGIFFLRRWRAAKKQASHAHGDGRNDNLSRLAGGDDPAPPQVDHADDNPYEAVDHYYNNIPANIPLDSLKQHIRSKTEDDGFETEFKMIHYGLTAEHEVGKKPENKKRNRFIELFPYDHSRVTLAPDGDSTWDYINASFVTGYSDNTKFIAAQGPNPVTVDDFWRMVWQQNVRKIVMLTRLMEGTKKKCQQYWPEGNETMKCGNITIHTTLSTVRADFTIRKFKIQHTNSPKRTVTQFHFTTWPDHGVPTAPALVGFWKQVKHTDAQTDEEAGPPIIHCSAGVGRTGTFIALDSLVTQAETENKVNVFLCVARMREARMNMVQTEDQYQFVHEALIEALDSRGTFYTLSEFDKKYGPDLTYTTKQKEELGRQFQFLQSLEAEQKKYKVLDAISPENMNKNRSKDILPAKKFRPFLSTPAPGHNDYINAVLLPSWTRQLFYIVTQTPLPETVVDFWRLVYDHDCHIIVCLDDSQDAVSLYPKENTSSSVGPFRVKTMAEDKSEDNHVLRKMTITHKDETESRREILVFRFTSMDSTSAILAFINTVNSNSLDEDQKMLVHCFDGSRVSGFFCSAMNIISRLQIDKELDIFLTIRELKAIRPQFVQTYEQYKLCHDMVKEYIRSSSIYANM